MNEIAVPILEQKEAGELMIALKSNGIRYNLVTTLEASNMDDGNEWEPIAMVILRHGFGETIHVLLLEVVKQ